MVLADLPTLQPAATGSVARGVLTRVRAGWVHDDTIRHVAAAFPAARQQPLALPDPVEAQTTPRPRTPRSSTRTSRARTDQETAA